MSNLQAGKYIGRARAESLQFGYAKSGSEQVALTIDLLNEGCEGQSVTFFGSFASEKSTEITLRQLRDAGWTGESLTDTAGLGDVDITVEVYYEDYQGKPQMRVNLSPVGGRTFAYEKPITGKDISALEKRLKGAILQSRRPASGAAAAAPRAFTLPGGGSNGAPVAAPTAPPARGDDIPF